MLFDPFINGRSFDFDVDIVSDYIDGNGLVNGMNSILAKAGYEEGKRFCDVSGGVLDFGIAFISPEKEKELAVNGLIWMKEFVLHTLRLSNAAGCGHFRRGTRR